MDLTSSFFEIFNLPVSFTVDQAVLSERYRALQQQFHPDRYVQQSSYQQRIAEQYTAFINQGFTTLKSPLSRAQYLLEIQGVEAGHENTTHQDMVFLMEQMQLRETLGEIPASAAPIDELFDLSQAVEKRFKQLQDAFAAAYNEGSYALAGEEVAKMQFFKKLREQIRNLEADLDEF